MGRRKKSEALPPPRFTKEEYEKLVANGKAIEQYIREEILPKLPTVIWLEFEIKSMTLIIHRVNSIVI